MNILPKYLMILALLMISLPSISNTLQPFTSDGCSAFPDGTLAQENLWLACCQQHDFEYWQGGTYQQRLASDNALKQCVSEVGQPQIAKLMLAGVRVGGTPYLPTTFRWGYGWPYPRFYGELTADELIQVQKEKEKIKIIILNNN